MRYRLDKNYKAHVKLDKWDSYSHYDVMAKMIYPLLVDYRKCECGYPAFFEDEEEWWSIVDKMVYAFKIIATEDTVWGRTPEDSRAVKEGLELFGKYFETLWT